MSGRAVEILEKLLDNRSGRIKLEASRTILGYAWGLPRQTVELTGLGDLAGELAEALRAVRERRELAATSPTVEVLPAVPEEPES
jgi:hypothetical protein